MNNKNKIFPKQIESEGHINASLNEVSIALNGLLKYEDVYKINTTYTIKNSDRNKISEEGVKAYLREVEYIEIMLKEMNEGVNINYSIKYKTAQYLLIKVTIALILFAGLFLLFTSFMLKGTFFLIFAFIFFLIFTLLVVLLLRAYTTKSLNRKFYNFFLVRIISYVKIVRKKGNENIINNEEKSRFINEEFQNRFN